MNGWSSTISSPSSPAPVVEEITISPLKWESYDDPDHLEQGFTMYTVWGHNLEDEPIVCIIQNYPNFLYYQLPLTIDGDQCHWFETDAQAIHTALWKRLGDNQSDLIPYQTGNFTENTWRMFYYLDVAKPVIKFCFKNSESLRHAANILRGGVFPDTRRGRRIVGEVHLNESDLNGILKLMVDTGSEPHGWIKCWGTKVQDVNRKQTHLQEYVVQWESMRPLDIPKVPKPRWCAFDIEQYSHNHKAFPSPWLAEDPIILITLVFYQDGEPPDKWRIYAVMKGDCIIKNQMIRERAIIIKVEDEITLLREYANLIIKEDPDIITGYNILQFDFKVMTIKVDIRGLPFPGMGRFRSLKDTRTRNIKWQSSAFKSKNLYIPNIEGRIIVDLFEHTIRNYSWGMYTLDNAGREILPEREDLWKIHMPAERQFQIYEAGRKASKRLEGWRRRNNPKYSMDRSRKAVVEDYRYQPEVIGLDEELTSEGGRQQQQREYQEFLDNLVGGGEEECTDLVEPDITKEMEDMGDLVEYGIYDSLLVAHISQKINWSVGLREMSNATSLQMCFLLVRGTQARNICLLYREAMSAKIILNTRVMKAFFFKGGLVQDPVPGVHELVFTIDFQSLYPSIMIAENLCPSTLIAPWDWARFAQVPHKDFRPLICDRDPEKEEDDLFGNKKSGKGKKKKEEIKYTEGHFKFATKEAVEGLTPRVLRKLLDKRAAVRAIKYEDEESIEYIVQQQKQLAIKICANALYGFYGVTKGGKRPCMEIAATTTHIGRESITRAKEWILANFDCEIVYGDTDSLMIKPRGTPVADLWELGKQIAKGASALFRGLAFTFEGYSKILLIKHKHYMKMPYKFPKPGQPFTGELERNKDGSLKEEIKGLTPARRDNCQFVRQTTRAILTAIIEGYKFYDIVKLFTNKVVQLYSGEISPQELVMTKGMGSGYKSETATMRVFAAEMQKKGQIVAAGERHQFIVTHNPGEKSVSKRMLLLSLYEMSPVGQRPMLDFEYYFKNLLMKKIDTYVSAAFGPHMELLQTVKFYHRSQTTYATTPAKFLHKVIKSKSRIREDYMAHMFTIRV